MAFKLQNFKTDEKKEIEGSWEEMGDGGSVLVARAGNKNYADEFRKIPKGIRRMIEAGNLASNAMDEVICKLLAKTVLLDWKGIEDEGKEIKHSIETAAIMLMKYPEFREFVWELANDLQRFHDDSVEADSKNSKAASGGN